jgi:hypothetical protein
MPSLQVARSNPGRVVEVMCIRWRHSCSCQSVCIYGGWRLVTPGPENFGASWISQGMILPQETSPDELVHLLS